MIKIAVDGYAGSGKSTLVKILGERLGCRVLDTGAIFRAFAVGFLKSGKRYSEKEVEDYVKDADVSILFKNDGQHMYLGKEDVTKNLRTEEVSMLASKISALKPVREKYLSLAKVFCQQNDCIMEGRDIGSVVMPDADVKFFLTADEKIRAKRRFDEAVAKGQKVEFEKVLSDLKKRDHDDTTRANAPLKPTNESVVVDNSSMNLQETAEFCLELIEKKLGKKKTINITFDGYVCSGKSTIARALAKRLGFEVFDTGAVYRGIACAFSYMGLDESKIDERYMKEFSRQINVRIFFSNGVEHVVVNGIDHTKNLRTEKTSALTAKISPFVCIREKVLALQRSFAQENDLCMEGRDIGSYVLPNADFKFFCTADEKVRAQRRFEQQRTLGNDVEFDEILKQLHARDYADTHRDHGALKKCADSIVIDTTNQTVEESVEFCLKHIRKKFPQLG